MKKSSSSVAVFFKAFIISIIVFTIISSIVLLWLVYATASSNNNLDNTSSEKSLYSPSQEESINILFAGCKTRGDIADIFILIRYDPIKQNISVMSIPSKTQSTVNIKTSNISKLYDYGGIYYATEGIANLFNVSVDRYFRVSDDAFANLCNIIGNITFDVPYDIEYSYQGVPIKLRKGVQALDGSRMVALMRYDNQDYSEADKANLQAEIITQLINQKLKPEIVTSFDRIYNEISNTTDTNFSVYDYKIRLESLKYFSTIVDPAKKTEIFGTYTQKNGFVFNISTISTVENFFK